ncbi:hypothetical protein RHS01_04053 [Rhizoctonia solani]|uniref:Uncharacterized protein n=1 Tax=Rhizoctonia solani TaxID=456999 RepID=A0A8H7M2V3_9AGAM|nr:hypothetical protein RHS01_04053 [Rhizoctonia solani]
MSTTLQGLNVTPGSPSSISSNSTHSTITVQALPGTDLWRKPPSTVSTNAPAYVVYRPLRTFKRARVTVGADWTRLYDQGGLFGRYWGRNATIEVEPEQGGPSLYVYLVEGEKRTLIREVTWVFQEKHDQLLGVGVYAARPTKVQGEEAGKGDALSVNFEGLEIEWTE